MIARTEAGDLVTGDRIAIGISESLVKQLLEAPLPKEAVLGGRVRVRIEEAQPFFRGNNALLVFRASVRGVHLDAVAARLEIGGSLERMRIQGGTLVADVVLRHFTVLDTSLGSLGGNVIDKLVRENMSVLGGLLRPLEMPVRLEHSVEMDGLDEGVVVARAGVLPLEMTVAEVVPVGERLWVLLDARAGPWHPRAAAGR